MIANTKAMVSANGPMEDEEDEAIRIAIALSLGEDPDALPLGTPPRPSDLARSREARERAQERQRIRIRDQARDAELARREADIFPRPLFDHPLSFQERLHDTLGARRRPPPAKENERITVDLTLDDDDDDDVDDAQANLHPVIEDGGPLEPESTTSNKGSKDLRQDGKEESKNHTSSKCSGPPPGPSGGGGISGLLGGLDRKKMEEERLARLKKRKASELTGGAEEEEKYRGKGQKGGPTPISGLSHSSVYQRQALDWPPSARFGSPASSSGQASSRPTNPRIENGHVSTGNSSLPFPRGVVKKTWSRSQPRLGDDIKIEEVFQKDRLKLAVLSSFQWDDDWLISKLDMTRTRVILVAYAADDAQKEAMESNVPRSHIRFCFPPMQGIGAMHSKLQLLQYDDYLRIVVPTGNLVPYDWGETGTMENVRITY